MNKKQLTVACAARALSRNMVIKKLQNILGADIAIVLGMFWERTTILFAEFLNRINLMAVLGKYTKRGYDNSLYVYLLGKLKAKGKNKDYDIAGGLVLFFLSILIILIILYALFKTFVWGLLFLGFALITSMYRLYDLLIIHSHYTVVEGRKGYVLVRDAGRYVVLAMLNLLEIIISFNVINLSLEYFGLIKYKLLESHSVLDSIWANTIILLTFEYREIDPANSLIKFLIILEPFYFVVFLFFVFPIITSAIKVKVGRK